MHMPWDFLLYSSGVHSSLLLLRFPPPRISVLVYAWSLNPLSLPGLVLMIHIKPLIPILQCRVHIRLAAFSHAPHQPRSTERQLMALVDFPKMPRLSVEANDLLHRLRLELLPLIFVASMVGWRWQDEHPRLDLELMAVP